MRNNELQAEILRLQEENEQLKARTWDDCENVCEKGVIKYLKIIDEVLNDRD